MLIYSPASGTHYFRALNASGQVWNGTVYENRNLANWATYVLSTTSVGDGWYYCADVAGAVVYDLRVQAGGSPAPTDFAIAVTDPAVGIPSVVGSGADSCTITITDESGPIADADVWISSDSEGTNVVAGTLQTNSQGKVTFLLDAGTNYYLWMQKDGENSINGQFFTATAD